MGTEGKIADFDQDAQIALNLTDDGMVGQRRYLPVKRRVWPILTDEAKEGHNAFLEKRKPDFRTSNGFPKTVLIRLTRHIDGVFDATIVNERRICSM